MFSPLIAPSLMITDGNGAEGLSFDQDKSLIIIIIVIKKDSKLHDVYFL